MYLFLYDFNIGIYLFENKTKIKSCQFRLFAFRLFTLFLIIIEFFILIKIDINCHIKKIVQIIKITPVSNCVDFDTMLSIYI